MLNSGGILCDFEIAKKARFGTETRFFQKPEFTIWLFHGWTVANLTVATLQVKARKRGEFPNSGIFGKSGIPGNSGRPQISGFHEKSEIP